MYLYVMPETELAGCEIVASPLDVALIYGAVKISVR